MIERAERKKNTDIYTEEAAEKTHTYMHEREETDQENPKSNSTTVILTLESTLL
jgi:hypothetical protein